MDIILKGPFEQITWNFSSGHAGVVSNERADVLAGATVIDNNLTLDPPTVLKCIQDIFTQQNTSLLVHIDSSEGKMCSGQGWCQQHQQMSNEAPTEPAPV